jgi:hypothetical protein
MRHPVCVYHGSHLPCCAVSDGNRLSKEPDNNSIIFYYFIEISWRTTEVLPGSILGDVEATIHIEVKLYRSQEPKELRYQETGGKEEAAFSPWCQMSHRTRL